MNKTLYFDIETAVKLKKAKARTKATESKIVRTLIKRTTLDDMVIALAEDMKHADVIDLKRI